MMHTAELLEFFKKHRGDAIVIPGRGGRHWVPMNDGPLDLPVGDPAMGGHAGFGLGIALAQPKRKVALFDSEGDILMSLGILVTIAEQKPANLYHFILDNGVYATTGGLTWGLNRYLDLTGDVGYEYTDNKNSTDSQILRAGIGLTLKR